MSGLYDQTLGDIGFADRGVLPLLLRRIGLRAAVSRARASLEALANLLDQQCEPLACDGAVPRKESVGLTASDQQGGVEGGAIGSADSHALREDELLEGIKLVSQLLDRIDVGIRHGLFSGAGDAEGIEPATTVHRLCGGAK